jgi:hypothetical protein
MTERSQRSGAHGVTNFVFNPRRECLVGSNRGLLLNDATLLCHALHIRDDLLQRGYVAHQRLAKPLVNQCANLCRVLHDVDCIFAKKKAAGVIAEAALHRRTASSVKVFARLLLFRLCRMSPINLFHYPLCPPDTVRDGAHRRRNPRSAVVLRQLACREDAGGDQEHALATFIHPRKDTTIFALSSPVARRIL